jgi:hypothetical protein
MIVRRSFVVLAVLVSSCASGSAPPPEDAPSSPPGPPHFEFADRMLKSHPDFEADDDPEDPGTGAFVYVSDSDDVFYVRHFFWNVGSDSSLPIGP